MSRSMRAFSSIVFIGTLGCLLSACSSTQKVEKVNTDLEVKGEAMGEKIGLDSDGQAIVQKETEADEALRKQRWKNSEAENKLRHEHEQLELCRRDIADPRLGGSGEVTDIPEVDTLPDTSAVKEEFGIASDGKLKLVKKQLFTDRLEAERQYLKTLQSQLKLVSKHLVNCERKMGYARAKAGLQSTRYKRNDSLGHEYEDTLDAAFRNAAKDRARKTASED